MPELKHHKEDASHKVNASRVYGIWYSSVDGEIFLTANSIKSAALCKVIGASKSIVSDGVIAGHD